MKFDHFKKSFFDGRNDKKALIANLKLYISDFYILQKFISRFEKELSSFKGLLNHVVLGDHFLPKAYSELNKGKAKVFTDSVEQEMNWQVLSFIKHHDTINKFIRLRNEFEHYLIIADYLQARKILEIIEEEICISYWSIENTFILDEYQFGSEKNWETRNIVLSSNNDDLVRILGDFYSIKAESKYSFHQYNDAYEQWEELQAKSIYGLIPEFQNYMRFKANYLSFNKYDHYKSILHYECNASIIDRYIIFIRVAQHLLSEKNSKPTFLKSLLKIIVDKIQDKSLVQMLIVEGEYLLQKTDCDFDVIDVIDEYTKGNYLKSKELSKHLLIKSHSNYIELFQIYGKSLIEAKLEFEPITNVKSLANEIAQIFYNILSKNENTDNAFVELLKLSYVFNNTGIGIQFYDFIKDELDWKTEINFSIISRLNSKFINPSLSDILIEKEAIAKVYLTTFLQIFENSTTVQIFNNFYDNHLADSNIKRYENIPESKSLLYSIRNLILKNRFDEAIDKYNALLKFELSVIAEYEIMSNLYYCYLSTQDYRNCLTVYINAYLKNPNLVKKMDANTLLGIIIKGKFKNIGDKKNLIELPIFFKINCTEKIKVKQAYELFLSSNNCTKPSEFISIKGEFNIEKLIYFLRNVCVPEIIQLSKFLFSTYNVNEERIAICQFLAEFDKLNSDIYNDEIAYLTKKNAVNKVIGRIDEGKIFVNEDKIKNSILKNKKSNISSKEENISVNEATFERYIALKKFLINNEYQDFKAVFSYDDDGKMIIEEIENLSIYSKDDFDAIVYYPAFRVFKMMFLFVRDNFVSNNEFGLDAYLSTRIRHGTLPNHIRSIFEIFNLVTAQTDGYYSNNDFWQDKLNLADDKKKDLQYLLANFSKQVDEISTMLKEDWIQYKTEKRIIKNHALFDYSYDDLELMPLYLEHFEHINKYEDFIDRCFIELWNRTEECLNVIQKKLNNDIKERFVSLITDLEHKIEKIAERASISELLHNVNLCRTEIQTLLSNIAKWFRRAESSVDGEYELQMLAETSAQITRNINPNYGFEIEKQVFTNLNIKGEYHQYFIDLINNCLSNMIKHSKLPSEKLNAKLVINEINNDLYLKFLNCVADSILAPELVYKLQLIKDNWLIQDTNISQEGGTGFSKIKKILHSDLNRKSSDVDFNFNENILTISLCFETNNLKA